MGKYKLFNCKSIGIDPASNGLVIAQSLIETENINAYSYPQYHSKLDAPTQSLLAYTLNNSIAHGGNKLLAWNIENMGIDTKVDGQIKPIKANKKTQRIDAAIALIMAMGTGQSTLMPVKEAKKIPFGSLSSFE